jgi:protein N-terminal methyltransferase
MGPTEPRIGKKVPIAGMTESTFYSGGANYWATQEASDNGMLGGLGHLSEIEIQNSEQFLKSLLRLPDAPGTSRVIDCGAGIGRITKNLLQRYFDVVDLVDQDSKFIDTAKENLKDVPKVGELYCSGLQSFTPAPTTYDVIWCQWVLCYMTDDDLVQFLLRCRAALRPNGLMIIKENTTRGKEPDIDESDSSVTRSFNGFLDIFKKANMKVLQYVKQKNFPKDLYPVWIFAVKPHSYNNSV